MDSYAPLVSVIVTNYNHADWVMQRIDSVLYQTYQHIELIILDDASTDHSKQVLENYAANPLVKTIIFNEINTGSPFKQWKKGFEHIRGELVWIAESDDFSDPQLLEKLVPAFADPECVFAYCDLVMVDGEGNPLFPIATSRPVWYDGRDFLQQKMTMYDSLYNTGQVIFRRSALQQVSETYQHMLLSGDYRLFCEIIIQGKVFSSGLPHAYFRKHSGEMTTKYLGTIVYHREHLDILDWLIERRITGKEIIRKKVLAELVKLYCARKGMSLDEYNKMVELFRSTCASHQLEFPHIRAVIKALQLKGNHFYRKKIKGNFVYK